MEQRWLADLLQLEGLALAQREAQHFRAGNCATSSTAAAHGHRQAMCSVSADVLQLQLRVAFLLAVRKSYLHGLDRLTLDNVLNLANLQSWSGTA